VTLPKFEMEIVHDLILDVVNGVTDRGLLLYKLKRLRFRYGEQPIILSTQADFIDSVEDRLQLYIRAVVLTENGCDIACLTQSAESVLELYMDDFSDVDKAEIWYSKLCGYIEQFGDEYLINTIAQLKERLDCLVNESRCSSESL
jgi:hypothetical protein